VLGPLIVGDTKIAPVVLGLQEPTVTKTDAYVDPGDTPKKLAVEFVLLPDTVATMLGLVYVPPSF
jgi:hypothetical protein